MRWLKRFGEWVHYWFGPSHMKHGDEFLRNVVVSFIVIVAMISSLILSD